jgi:sec-independent protein translocase protein TatC
MQKASFAEHFTELKKRVMYIILFLSVTSMFGYYFVEDIYSFITHPLIASSAENRKVIYTGLAEVFLTYIKISFFFGFLISFPFICYQIYAFISPGLLKNEKKIVATSLLMAPILFYIGAIFMFYLVIPKAWSFFIGFEIRDAAVPLLLEAKISEYISLVIQLIIAFGLAFEMPVIILILTSIGIFSSNLLINNKRYAIVLIFIFAGIVTPPDILSQIALAIPMILLYEVSIKLCRLVEQTNNN